MQSMERSLNPSDEPLRSQPDEDENEQGTDALSQIPAHFGAYVQHLKTIPPLNSAQQAGLLEMTRDEEEPHESRRWATSRLWLDALKFVLYVRMKLRNSMPFVRLDDMDMIQEGNLAAGLALATWEPARGTLTTWLYPHVRGALLDYARSDSRIEQGLVSLDDVVGSETLVDGQTEEEPYTVAELLVYDHHVFEDPETVTEYGQVRKLLIEEHGANGWGDLAADFLIGATNVRELAAKYEVSVPTVYNRMRRMGF